MSSLVTKLNSTGNCKLGRDYRRVRLHRRRDSTRQLSRVDVGFQSYRVDKRTLMKTIRPSLRGWYRLYIDFGRRNEDMKHQLTSTSSL